MNYLSKKMMKKKEIFKGNLQRKKEKKQSKDDNLKNEDEKNNDEEDKKEGEVKAKPKWVYKPKFRPKKNTFYIRLARVEIQQESDSEEI
jgi:hypothetical protein